MLFPHSNHLASIPPERYTACLDTTCGNKPYHFFAWTVRRTYPLESFRLEF